MAKPRKTGFIRLWIDVRTKLKVCIIDRNAGVNAASNTLAGGEEENEVCLAIRRKLQDRIPVFDLLTRWSGSHPVELVHIQEIGRKGNPDLPADVM